MFDPFKVVNTSLPVNDARLLVSTRCKVLKMFYVRGKLAEVGSVVTLPFHNAQSLASLAKVELLR